MRINARFLPFGQGEIVGLLAFGWDECSVMLVLFNCLICLEWGKEQDV